MTASRAILPSFFLVSIFGIGCAGGPGPDLAGPDGPAIMEAFSGTWFLVPEESETFAEKSEGAMSATGGRRPGNPGGDPQRR